MGKFIDYTELTSPASDDVLIIDDTSAGATKKITVSNLIGTSLTLTMFQGCLQRPKFTYNNTTSILIGAGWYEHNGTAQQMLYWNSQLTYTFGSGGSNANSTDLGASETHYLYIDDSELSGVVMVAGEFVNSTTAPSWSETKHGWYNGNDRCIGVFRTNGSSELVSFSHDGGDLFEYTESVTDRAVASLAATTWTAVTLTVPNFGDHGRALCGFLLWDAASTNFYYRKTGSGATTGNWLANTASSAVVQSVTREVTYDSSQQIDIYASAAASGVTVYTHGYYFPRGM